MDHLSRLMASHCFLRRLLSLVVLLLACNCALAGTAWNGTNLGSNLFATKEDACLARVKSLGGGNTYTMELYNGGPSWRCNYPGGSTGYVQPYTCTTNLKASGTIAGVQNYVCSVGCPAGQTAVNGYCVTTCPASGTQVAPANTVFEAGTGLTSVVCLASCEASAFMAAKGADGKNYVWGPIISTGKSCQAGQSSAPAGAEPPTKCSVGQCPGTVNGTTRCFPCSETKETTTKTSAESSTSAASGAASGPASSSTSGTSSSTSCKDGTCTTTETTTTTSADGTKTDKSTTKTQDQNSFCAENPKAASCKGLESSWGGSCSSGFQCEGTAVECAIAQASWKSACATEISPTDSKVTAGNNAMSAGDRPLDHPGNNPTSSVFSANLDQSNPYSSECPADIPLDVMGQSFSIPLTHACGSFQFMGKVVVAFALVAAAYIVFGAVKG